MLIAESVFHLWLANQDTLPELSDQKIFTELSQSLAGSHKQLTGDAVASHPVVGDFQQYWYLLGYFIHDSTQSDSTRLLFLGILFIYLWEG